VRGRAYRALDRYPVIGDSVLAGLVVAFSLTALYGETSRPSAAEIVFSVVLAAPLVARRRSPVGVFAVVMALCALQLLFVDRFLGSNLAALVALYTLVAYAARPIAAAGCAVALAGAGLYAWHFQDLSDDGAFLVGLVYALHLALAAALGDRRHAKLVERAALEERTRLLALERDQRAALAAAGERARIARELHDVVAHALSVMVAQADGGRYGAAGDPELAATALRTIARTGRDAQAEMRRTLGLLDAPGGPGLALLPELVERTSEAGVAVALRDRGTPQPLPADRGMALYRVAQEALTNVLRHAGPGAAVRVDLDWEGDRLTLVVRDDGAGRSRPTTDGRGRGLAGMRARIEPHGGTLAAGPAPGGGFEVRATLPLDARSPRRAVA
jgi:signal transduction histidine kinase